MAEVRLVSNGLIFSGNKPFDIQLVTFLLLSNIVELSIGGCVGVEVAGETIDNHHCV